MSLFYSLPLRIKQRLTPFPGFFQGTYEQYTKTNTTTTTKVTLRGFCDWLLYSPSALDPSSYLLQRRFSYVSHIGSLVMGHPDLTIHHMVRVYPGGRFDYRTPLSMGQPDPEQSFTNYGTAVGNNAPYEWSGWVYLDCHIPPLCRGIGGVPAAIIILRIT